MTLIVGAFVLAAAWSSAISTRVIALHDVQGLFGGHNIWIVDGRSVFVQKVGRPRPAQNQPGLGEQRYQFELAPAERDELERLLDVHHFLTIKVDSSGPGVPDEARPTVVVVSRSGQTVRASKWANDKHSEFDPIYRYLLAIGDRGTEKQIVYDGAYQGDWRPPGIDPLW
jgi:hypothetical protein